MKRSLLLLLVSLAPAMSCGGTPESSVESVVVEVPAAERADDLPTEATEPDDVVAAENVTHVEPTLPAGFFRDLDALCAQQKIDVVPLLAKARHDMQERYGDEASPAALVPSCKVDAAAMRGARVSLRAPYLEARAVTYETGNATQTNVVVRTAEGWTSLGTALVATYHDDPGCASILRDAGLVEVRAVGERVIVLDKADRGWGDQSSIVYERARTCSLSGCTAPVTVGARTVTWETHHEKRVFETTYRVDASGAIVVANAYKDPWEPTDSE